MRTALLGLMVIGAAALSGCAEHRYGDDYSARAPAPVYGQSYYGTAQPYYAPPVVTHEEHEDED